MGGQEEVETIDGKKTERGNLYVSCLVSPSNSMLFLHELLAASQSLSHSFP